MKIGMRIALAAIVAASSAAPAMAGEWVYHGGPRSPDSLTNYVPDDYAYYPYARPSYGYGYGYGYRYASPETDY